MLIVCVCKKRIRKFRFKINYASTAARASEKHICKSYCYFVLVCYLYAIKDFTCTTQLFEVNDYLACNGVLLLRQDFSFAS